MVIHTKVKILMALTLSSALLARLRPKYVATIPEAKRNAIVASPTIKPVFI